MGAGGFGEYWVKTMSDPKAFKIVHNVDRAGCCWCPTFCFCAKGQKARSYLVISESFIHSNESFPHCCCCCLRDRTRMMFFDRYPISQTACERIFKGCLGGGDFVTEHDMCYCCYFIPCIDVYNVCCRPCCGGFVARTMFSRSQEICFLLETRCFHCYHLNHCGEGTRFIMCCVGDSVKSKDALSIELNMFRKNGGGEWAFAG